MGHAVQGRERGFSGLQASSAWQEAKDSIEKDSRLLDFIKRNWVTSSSRHLAEFRPNTKSTLLSIRGVRR